MTIIAPLVQITRGTCTFNNASGYQTNSNLSLLAADRLLAQ